MSNAKNRIDNLITKKLTVAGVDITASASEINSLDGVTASADELNILDGVTSSAAELNILDGVTKTASQLNAVVIGVAGGYKIARSAAPVALDGSNPTSVAHGLTTCLVAFAQLSGSSAPGAGTSTLSAVVNGANIDVYGWKPTTGGAAGNPTLIASDGTESFHWFAVGT